MNDPHDFFEKLRTHRTACRRGLMAAGLLRGLAALLATGILAGLWDRMSPWADPSRVWVTGSILLAGLITALLAAIRAVRFGSEETADQADTAGGLSRRPIRAALDLAGKNTTDSETPLRAWLLSQSLESGAEALTNLPRSAAKPGNQLKRAGGFLACVLAVIAVLVLIHPAAFQTIGARLLQPWADHPPYSPLQFTIEPDDLTVMYGDGLDLEVAIQGGAPPGPVILLTRTPGGDPGRASAYAKGGGRFSQRLERVVRPLEVAFSSGHARSHWHTVEVIRQPRVDAATVRLFPPGYSGLADREFALGTSEVAGLVGTEVELTLSSNRPLSRGEARIEPAEGLTLSVDGTSTPATTERIGDHELRFTWKLAYPGKIVVEIRDIAGTPAAAPLEIIQKVLPDEPPRARLHSPGPMVLATPESTVPVSLDVEDDFGLSRVDLVRTLTGFRDRVSPLAEALEGREFHRENTLELSKLGVSPGQTLEFYAEAHDHNPSLMGIGSSAVGRVQIISKEQYAEILRTRAELAEFEARFRVLNDALAESREALEQLQTAADSGDDQALKEAQRRALNAHKLAQQSAEMLARDFSAFALEEDLAKAAADMATQSADHASALERAALGGASSLGEEARRQLKTLRGTSEIQSQLQKKAEQAAAVGRVLEVAARLRALEKKQASVTENLENLSRSVMGGDLSNVGRLQSLASQQQENLEEWKRLLEDAERTAAQLPPDFAKLADDVADFLERAAEMGVEEAMEEAVTQAKRDRSPETFVNAQLALVGIQQLLNTNNNSFCQSAQSGQPGFGMPQDLEDTLRQMMAGFCKKHGEGEDGGSGEGTGRGMGGASGYSILRQSMLDAPLYGPARSAFRPEAAGGTQGDARDAPGISTSRTISDDARSGVESSTDRGETRRTMSLRDVPAAYREAVKRFYGDDAFEKEPSNETPDGTPES